MAKDVLTPLAFPDASVRDATRNNLNALGGVPAQTAGNYNVLIGNGTLVDEADTTTVTINGTEYSQISFKSNDVLAGFIYGFDLGGESRGLAIGVPNATHHLSLEGKDLWWNTSQKIYRQGNIVGTVSQSGGVPTGAIIEQGSNANGSYTKFADGTLICRHHFTGLGPLDNDLGNKTFSAASRTSWNYPVIFIAQPAPYVASGSQSYIWGAIHAFSGTSKCDFDLISPIRRDINTLEAYVAAIGRWY